MFGQLYNKDSTDPVSHRRYERYYQKMPKFTYQHTTKKSAGQAVAENESTGNSLAFQVCTSMLFLFSHHFTHVSSSSIIILHTRRAHIVCGRSQDNMEVEEGQPSWMSRGLDTMEWTILGCHLSAVGRDTRLQERESSLSGRSSRS